MALPLEIASKNAKCILRTREQGVGGLRRTCNPAAGARTRIPVSVSRYLEFRVERERGGREDEGVMAKEEKKNPRARGDWKASVKFSPELPSPARRMIYF